MSILVHGAVRKNVDYRFNNTVLNGINGKKQIESLTAIINLFRLSTIKQRTICF